MTAKSFNYFGDFVLVAGRWSGTVYACVVVDDRHLVVLDVVDARGRPEQQARVGDPMDDTSLVLLRRAPPELEPRLRALDALRRLGAQVSAAAAGK